MDFLDSLEAAFEGQWAVEREAEAHELAEAARLSINLADLIREQQGRRVDLELFSGARIAGLAVEVNSAWAQVVDQAGNRTVVALAAIAAMGAPGRAGTGESLLQSRQKIGMVMREIARSGRVVLVTSVAGQQWRGRLSGVGADYLELDRRCAVRLAVIESVRVC